MLGILMQNSTQSAAPTLLSDAVRDLLLSDAFNIAGPAGSASPFALGKYPGPVLEPILVVEDEPVIRGLLAATLNRAGFRADTAQDGEDGWRALRVTPYAIVITDHQMPRLTGLQLIERMRDNSMDVPCILISGNMPPNESLTALGHPIAILEKPFSPLELLESVVNALLYRKLQAS
jgi:DNA-binding NtrC family response regulator